MGQTVLVVDDDPDIRSLATLTLRHVGYKVIEAKTGEEALEVIARDKPEGLLLDIQLPDIDGWEVLERLRKDSPLDGLGVVVFSAYGGDGAAEKAIELGSKGFLAKPFDPRDLAHAMQSAMAGREGVDPAEDRGVARHEGVDQALADHLEPDEQVEVTCDALLRVAGQFFTKCRIVLTDRKLILLKQAWPRGYKVNSVHDRANCSVFRHKARMDGSQLLAIQEGDEKVALYFNQHWSDEATRLRKALTPTG